MFYILIWKKNCQKRSRVGERQSFLWNPHLQTLDRSWRNLKTKIIRKNNRENEEIELDDTKTLKVEKLMSDLVIRCKIRNGYNETYDLDHREHRPSSDDTSKPLKVTNFSVFDLEFDLPSAWWIIGILDTNISDCGSERILNFSPI